MSQQKDYSQNIIKARVAETIIQELFIQNGYNVFNYGMERTMPTLVGKLNRNTDEVSTAIRSMPDFVVQHIESGELLYVEVKFRSSGKFDIKELLINFPYENAHFIIVSKNAIKCISFKDLKNGEVIEKDDNRLISNYPAFQLSDSSIERFLGYINNFFGFVKA